MKRVYIILLAVFIVCMTLPPIPARAVNVIDPAHTWIFAVGVLNFDDSSFATWPDKGREDARMISLLIQRGVRADHIVFMKNQECTKAKITARLDAFLKLLQPGDLLIFYYAGHGSRDFQDPQRPVSFVTYDTKEDWRILDILAHVDANFKGSKAILLADCCYSGGLVEAMARRKPAYSVAVITSAQPTSSSTGNWTFTRGICDALEGSPMVDLNGDGKITLGEVAAYEEKEMADGEGQLSGSYFAGPDLNADSILTESVGPKPARVGEWLQAKDQGTWYNAKILKVDGARFFVAWGGYEASENSWVHANETRPITFKSIPNGTSVSIEWDGKQYPGTVVASKLGLFLVHYQGYKDIDNEWVTPDRLKMTSAAHVPN